MQELSELHLLQDSRIRIWALDRELDDVIQRGFRQPQSFQAERHTGGARKLKERVRRIARPEHTREPPTRGRSRFEVEPCDEREQGGVRFGVWETEGAAEDVAELVMKAHRGAAEAGPSEARSFEHA